MAGVKINARDIILEIQDSDDTWIEIDGLTSVTINKSENEENVDTTTFASEGHYEQEIMQRGATMTLEGFLLQDDTGTQDPGQARCEDIATMMAQDSVGRVRHRHPNENEWREWDATVSVGEQGGGNNAKTSWNATLTRSGKPTTSAVA